MSELNLTMLLQGERVEDQIGYHSAFAKLANEGALTGYRAYPYRGLRTDQEWAALYEDVLAHMEATGSNALHLQYFHGRDLPDIPPFVRRVRELPGRPVISTSCGDGFGPRLSPPPRSLRTASVAADITFATSMGRVAASLARAGGRRITLMPNSACQVRFGEPVEPLPEAQREFDVVFIGSASGSRNPTRHHFWAGRKRTEYVESLASRYGRRFAVFGHGWDGLPSWQGPIPFDAQVETNQRGRVVVGGYPGSWCDYYTSNRPFMSLLSGVPTIDYQVPRVDRLLADGEDWVLMPRSGNVVDFTDRLLEASEDERAAIGRQGAQTVWHKHMNLHRAKSMVRILSDLRDDLLAGRRPRLPHLDYFRDGIDQADERAHALVGW